MATAIQLFLVLLASIAQETATLEIRDKDPYKETEMRVRCGGVYMEDPLYAMDADPNVQEPNKDKSAWKPFHVHFVTSSDVEDHEAKQLLQAYALVNDRLKDKIRTWTLTELRAPRFWDRIEHRCAHPNYCGSVQIANKYNKPCVSPDKANAEAVVQPGVSQPEPPAIKTAREEGVSLIVFVGVQGDQCEPDVSAYSHVCFWDVGTLRPTHGSINLCAEPTKLSMRNLVHILTHQVMHIASRGTLLGYRHPKFVEKLAQQRPLQRLEDADLMRAENVTWESVQHNWTTWDISVSPKRINTIMLHHAVVASSERIRASVQEYFGFGESARIAGAEIAKKIGLLNRVIDDDAHWSMRLFPDELMAPIRTDAQHLSKLTLNVLEESGWYETDPTKAETLMFDLSALRHPGEVVDGCATATEYCENYPRRLRENRLDYTYPFCHVKRGRSYDDEMRQEHCSENGRYRLTCTNFGIYSDNCAIHVAPLINDHSGTDCRSGEWQSRASLELGFSIGEQSTCVHFTEINAPDLGWTHSHDVPACVRYECKRDGADSRIRFLIKHFPSMEESKRTDCWSRPSCGNYYKGSVQPVTWNWEEGSNQTCITALRGRVACPRFDSLCGATDQKLHQEETGDNSLANPNRPVLCIDWFLIVITGSFSDIDWF